jgi:hypothetical protein
MLLRGVLIDARSRSLAVKAMRSQTQTQTQTRTPSALTSCCIAILLHRDDVALLQVNFCTSRRVLPRLQYHGVCVDMCPISRAEAIGSGARLHVDSACDPR